MISGHKQMKMEELLMKRLLALFFALVMLLGVTAGASAAPFYLEAAGVTIDVPEGFEAQDASTDQMYALSITDPNDPTVEYAYALRYYEEYAGLWFDELDPSVLEGLGAAIAANMEGAELAEAEVNDYYVLIAADGAGTQLHYMSFLNGWFCDVAVGNPEGVTEEQIQTTAALLTSIEFDEAEEDLEDGEEEVLEEEEEIEE